MVYGLTESKSDFFQNNETEFASESNPCQELDAALTDAKIYAEKGIIDGMNYCIQDALKYSRILCSDISDELKELRELALENHEKIHSLSELLKWVEHESKTVKPVFLSNVLRYAKSVADIFGWSIDKELEAHYKTLEKYKAKLKKKLPTKRSQGMIRIAGYADL
ncbi:MAG: hypothetical protein PHG04_01680 [Candidatus Nanoarchaeia archaeon]|nr:hypothetical protein [Candidatus Nanoarchaeia archaeon]